MGDVLTDDGLALMARVNAFLGLEAGLLDRREWHGWLGLFAPEGRYWAPVWNGDEEMTNDPSQQLSLIYADTRELQARIFRIEGADSYASLPLPHTSHLVTCTAAHRKGQGTVVVQANWLLHAFWRTKGAIMRGGQYRYELQETEDGFQILQKTVFMHDDRVVGPLDIYSL
ncbi:MAG: hypothetical protein DI601_21250 [Azospirillum brasilense]|nr:MAG: hypothetical protein DI601_21250 [Azospirillum brasilense]